MGRDKALLAFHGAPLARWIAAAVAQAAHSATLIGPPELYSNLGYPVVPDLYPGEGPLGGILTALHHSASPWNLVVACDMPELAPPTLSKLLDAARQSNAQALLPIANGRPQPLCAVYHRDCAGPFAAVFSQGVRAVVPALAEVRTVHLPIEEVACFQNVNTPEDWAAYARR
jgi:molybdopterin-guanine dinucleotide biosynthesis protein A